jgi:PAS domain S-box-containing protein
MTAETTERLLKENQELRRRLAVAEQALAVSVEPGEKLARLPVNDVRFREILDALPAAVYTTDAEGIITHFNPAAVDLAGRVPEVGVEKWCVTWKLLRPDGTPLPHDECPMAVCLKEGRVVRGEEAIAERPDGTRRRFEAFPTPLFDETGKMVAGVNMLVDVTERRQADEVRALLAAIVDSSDDAIVSKNLDAIITSWNAGAERLFGYTAAEMIGKSVTLLIPPERQDEEPRILSRLKRGERVDHFDTVRIRKDGSPIEVSLTISPIRDADGRIIGASKIARDITERRRLDQALRDADRRKDEFLATLAHELRNPLAPIRNAVQILQAKGPPLPELSWARGVIDRQVLLMSRLLEDLLDVSRIARNKLELRNARVPLAPIIETALETSRPLIERGGHKLVVDLPPEPLILEADSMRLAQVFANLLNNAAKYTEHGGAIRLTARRLGDEVSISVRDNGIGISPEMLPLLFEIFTQATPALDRSQGGLGVGLSLVKGLVELHRGRVEAHSDGPGHGSEFIVRLPLAASESRSVGHSTSRNGKPRPTTGRRILVVDDNRDGADSLAMLLEAQGHDVTVAYDGKHAIQSAEVLRPDLTLLDIGMPGLDGHETCRRIREQPWGQDLVLIALTGFGQEEDRRRTLESGFDHHLVKPLHPDDLERILSLLAHRKPRVSAD